MEEHEIDFFIILVSGRKIINGHAILPKKLGKKTKKTFLDSFWRCLPLVPKKKSASVAQWAAGGGEEESVKICPPPKKREERPEKGKRRNCPKDIFPLDSNSHNTCFPRIFPLLQQRNTYGGVTMGVLLGPPSSAGCLEKSSAIQWVFFWGADHQQHRKSHNMQSSA